MKNKINSIKNIKLAFMLNLLFSFLECIGGLLTNSISIFSDAIHDFGDSLSIGISYLLEKISCKKSDKNYTYGYLRYSLLGAVVTSTILIIGSIIVIYNSIPRLFNPQEINYNGMIIFAIFGTLINGYTAYKTSNSNVKNEKAINLHMLEDFLGWIAVLLGSIIIKISKLYIIDPILSILIALYILLHVYHNIKEVFYIFMDKVPENIDIDNLKHLIEKKFELIDNIHHIHIWTLDGTCNYLTAHIKLKNNIDEKNIIKLKKELKEYLFEKQINHSTIEIEYKNEKCNNIYC